MTTFVKVLEEGDKSAAVSAALRAIVECRQTPAVFDVAPTSFAQVPGSPFAYWVSERVRRLFHELPAFESRGRTVKQGLATADDFRFVRSWWEVPAFRILDAIRGPSWRDELEEFQSWCRKQSNCTARWVPFAKGGDYSPFYADVHLVVAWADEGSEIRNNLGDRGQIRSNIWMLKDTAILYFFRPGLTWPLRTQGGFSLRQLPAGCAFGHKGPVAFIDGRSPADLLGAMNSAAFCRLVELQTAFGSYEVGVIQRTPVPRDLPTRIGLLALEAVEIKRRAAAFGELNHWFTRPHLACCQAANLRGAAETVGRELSIGWRRLDAIQATIERLIFDAYGFDEADRAAALDARKGGLSAEDSVSDDDGETEGSLAVASPSLDLGTSTKDMLSWAVGCAFGRFDVRLATGEREAPPLPDPFDPLPVCSPGMLQGSDGLPATVVPPGCPLEFPPEGLLVDQEGHLADMTARVRQVLVTVWGDRAAAIEQEACEILQAPNLRTWLADPGGFFAHHLSRYSKSRRKAPIYWPLSTQSGSFTVWVYAQRLTEDTLYTLINTLIRPAIDEATRQASDLLGEIEHATGSRAAELRRRAERSVALVQELASFHNELSRVAALPYRPDLDDGILITASPLASLFRLPKWRKDLEACWKELERGKYDWSHLAMAIWPERVKAACRKDRSLAIAQGLESVAAATAPKPETVQAKKPSASAASRRPEAAPEADWTLQREEAQGSLFKPSAASAPGPLPSRSEKSVPASRREREAGGGPGAAGNAILAALRAAREPMGRAALVARTGIAEAAWLSAIRALMERGLVVQEGAKRGTVYRLPGGDV